MDNSQIEAEGSPFKDTFTHRGIEIEGVGALAERGVLLQGDVTAQIDKLPQRFFSDVPLGKIIFLPNSMFSIERDGQVIYIEENGLLPTDRVIARKRAVTGWNRELKDGAMVPTDGKMTIKIFSTDDWDGKADRQLDKDTALYALDHEFGHAIWGAIVYAPGIFDELDRRGIPLPSSRNASDLRDFIERWNSLPESSLPRYKDYREIFAQEHKNDATGYKERSLEELSKEEDFGISLENYFYWENLQGMDSERFTAIHSLMERMRNEA